MADAGTRNAQRALRDIAGISRAAESLELIIPSAA
jgi:hypothetical protein